MAGFLISLPRWLALTATLLALLNAVFYAAASFAAEEEKGVLADLISRALSTPATEISIGAIDGALSSDATIHDLKISDRDGVWLTVNRIRIIWRRLALLQRRLEIDKLDIDQMNVARRPVPAEAPVPGEEQPLLPELPLRVDIKQFSLAQLDLGQPVLGVASSFSTGGYVKLGPPSEGLQLFLDAQRLDRPATLNVRLNLVPESQRLDLSVNLDEPAGGILSTLANIPGGPPVKLSITGSGVLDAFNAKLAFDAGPNAGAQGTAALNRESAGRRLGLDLNAELSGLLPQMVAPVFAGTTKLTGNVFFGDDSAVTIPGVELAAAAARLDITGGLSAAQIADIRVSAKNVPNAGSRTALKDAEIRHLAFDAQKAPLISRPWTSSRKPCRRASRGAPVQLQGLCTTKPECRRRDRGPRPPRAAWRLCCLSRLQGVRLRLCSVTGARLTSTAAAGCPARLRMVTPQTADLTALMTIPDVSKADRRAKGRGEIAAHVTGTLSRPDGTASIAIRDAALLGRPVPRRDVQADAKNLTGALDARVNLDGEINRKPARGSLHIARPAAGGTILDGVDVSIGSVLAQGGVALDAVNFAAGQRRRSRRSFASRAAKALRQDRRRCDADTFRFAAGGRHQSRGAKNRGLWRGPR